MRCCDEELAASRQLLGQPGYQSAVAVAQARVNDEGSVIAGDENYVRESAEQPGAVGDLLGRAGQVDDAVYRCLCLGHGDHPLQRQDGQLIRSKAILTCRYNIMSG